MRQAIFDAGLGGGTITLSSELTISKDLTISGNVPITITCNDPGATGDPNNDYFYLVVIFDDQGQSLAEMQVAEFDFGSQPG